MGVLLPSHCYKLADQMMAAYLADLGTQSSGLGVGSGNNWGASEFAQNVVNLVSGESDSSFSVNGIQSVLSIPASNSLNQSQIGPCFSNQWSSFYFAWTALAAQTPPSSSIGNLDTFLYWYNFLNGVTFWQCLLSPEWYDAYFWLTGTRPNPLNVYFPCKVSLGYTNGLAAYIVSGSAYIQGYVIDTTKYAGGFAYVTWTGGTGSGASSVTVNGLDQQGNAETWVANGTWGSGLWTSSNLGIPLVPQNRSYSLISKATSVSTTGLSAGSLVIESWQTLGRSYPPT